MMLTREIRKALRLKKLVHYAVIFSAAWITYRLYLGFLAIQGGDRQGPRDIRLQPEGGGGEGHNANDLDINLHLDKGHGDLDPRGNVRDHRPEAKDNEWRERPQVEIHERKPAEDHHKKERGQGDTGEGRRNSDADGHIPIRGGRGWRGDEGGEGGGGGDGGHKEVEKKDPRLEIKDEEWIPINAPVEQDFEDEGFQVEKKIDWAQEEELRKRRKHYLEEVAKRAEEYDPNVFKDVQELHDDLAFMTAATDRTSWSALLQFVYSVQYFYPDSDIGVYDLGLTADRRKVLETLCKVSVIPTFMKFWPSHLLDLTRSVWRPMIWQMGLAHYGHVIYVEPERFLQRNNMKDYIDHSRRHGITVVGSTFQYSPFVVTHPETYHFLNVDTRKLQRVAMFDLTMLVMHNSHPVRHEFMRHLAYCVSMKGLFALTMLVMDNSHPVRHEFMRHLIGCTLEEYCIAPPGSRKDCDQRLYAGSKKYANCHRYDLSVVNILLDKWFDYNHQQFLVRDLATAHYDGSDASGKVKVCSGHSMKEEI